MFRLQKNEGVTEVRFFFQKNKMKLKQKQDYIHKIQDLIESNDKENMNLALQLMEGLALKDDILKLYGYEHPILQLHFRLDNKTLLQLMNKPRTILRILNKQDVYSSVVFEVMLKLLRLYDRSIELMDKFVQVKMDFQEKNIFVESKVIAKNDTIDIITNEIDKINLYSRVELMDYYIGTSKRSMSPNHAGLGWADIILETKNSIEYSIKPYEKNQVYSVFVFTIKMNMP